MSSAYFHELKPDFDLNQCLIRCKGSGGWKVSDTARFQTAFAPFLLEFKPRIVYIQIGENDLCTSELQPLTLASSIEDLASKLLNEFNVELVFVGELFTRQKTLSVSPELYEENRKRTNMYLTTLLEGQSRVRLWKHRRIFGSSNPIFADDGVHLCEGGQLRFYRSLRLALMTAVRDLQHLDQ